MLFCGKRDRVMNTISTNQNRIFEWSLTKAFKNKGKDYLVILKGGLRRFMKQSLRITAFNYRV